MDPKPVTLFYSYAHEDEDLRKELEGHLLILKRRGLLDDWHDRSLLAGGEWDPEIREQLEKADIILLLISKDFVVSKYAWDEEMEAAMKRHEKGEARVIPVLLRAYNFDGARFAKLTCIPRNRKAVASWDDKDEAFTEISREIERVVLDVRKKREA